MEPVTLAAIVSTLIFKAVEKNGEKLGEVAAEKISQLISVVRNKFQQKGVEGVLTQIKENPTEANQSMFKMMLEMHASEDKSFAETLRVGS